MEKILQEILEPDYAKTKNQNVPENGSKTRTIKTDEKEEYILLVLKHKTKLILAGLVSLAVSLFVFIYFFSPYESTVTFLIDDSDPTELTTSEPERIALSQLLSLSKNRMYLLIYSDEMARRLDQQIQLGEHFNIKKDNPNYAIELVGRIANSVTFQKNVSNIVYITVRDEDKFYAPLMANTIFENLQKLNLEIVKSNLDYKRTVYNLDVEEYKAKKNLELNTLIDLLKNIPDHQKSNTGNSDDFINLKREFNIAFTNYTNTSDKYLMSKTLYELNSDVMRDNSLQTLFIINKAFPNSRRSTILKSCFYSLLISFSIVLYYTLSIYFVNKYKPYLNLLLSKANQSNK